MAYKRELIINNGSLTSYKKLLKVSDVCQLIDTSKYPATQTINGVTFTNNGDGTITANGTATRRAQFNLNDTPVVEGHTYFLTGVAGSTGVYFLNSYFLSSTGWLKDNICYGGMTGVIYSYVPGARLAGNYIAIEPNAHANNLVFKPQLFDLTEMYGAGNEPATVAEFKAKFPNEMYDYSPRCWVTSYKTGLIAKTKNLFDKSKAIKGRAIRYIDGSEYDDAPYYASDYINVSGISTLTITPTHETPSVCFYDKNKTFISSTRTMIGVSVPSNAVYIRFDNKLTNLGTCQLEKGSTATDYVPYGYL